MNLGYYFPVGPRFTDHGVPGRLPGFPVQDQRGVPVLTCHSDSAP